MYAYSKDPANETTCYDTCADTWLPLLAKRRDGGNQVTYKGIPLYQYAGDKVDRDANGQGLDMFGGVACTDQGWAAAGVTGIASYKVALPARDDVR